jgi:hypothetical protein
MTIEFLPAEAFKDLSDPESAERFKALMRFQYDFPTELEDYLFEQLKKQEYWQKVAPDLLVLVGNEENSRFHQIGCLLFFVNGKYHVSFGDTIIERFEEDEILLLEKSEITPEVGIRVKFLDYNWEEVKRGNLVGYEKAAEKGGPPGWYLIQVGEEIKRVEDWYMLGGTEIRFFLE